MDFKVQNIVGTTDCGFPIRLEGLVYAHSGYASYEPELFPGLIYRLVNPRVVFLIFVSGKVVITGAKKVSFFAAHQECSFRMCFFGLLSSIHVLVSREEPD